MLVSIDKRAFNEVMRTLEEITKYQSRMREIAIKILEHLLSIYSEVIEFLKESVGKLAINEEINVKGTIRLVSIKYDFKLKIRELNYEKVHILKGLKSNYMTIKVYTTEWEVFDYYPYSFTSNRNINNLNTEDLIYRIEKVFNDLIVLAELKSVFERILKINHRREEFWLRLLNEFKCIERVIDTEKSRFELVTV